MNREAEGLSARGRKAAAEVRRDNINGWGNLFEVMADALDANAARIAELDRDVDMVADNLRAATEQSAADLSEMDGERVSLRSRLSAANALLEECERVLRAALDCGTAVVGASPDDPDADEAFSMWSDARTEGRQLLTQLRGRSK